MWKLEEAAKKVESGGAESKKVAQMNKRICRVIELEAQSFCRSGASADAVLELEVQRQKVSIKD